jgi:glycosyltransferase involved in cell wall biosynthesis
MGMASIDTPPSDPAHPLAGKRILLLSAYDAASHQHWRQQLYAMFAQCHWTTLSLPARYFAWRVRGNSLSWAFNHRRELTDNHDLVIATSLCDLASLRGFVPELARIPTLLYFHENQLAYPDSGQQHASVEPAMVNLYSALCADRLAFNSEWNRRSFLSGIEALLRKLPDAVPAGLPALLQAKSVVIPVPLEDSLFGSDGGTGRDAGRDSRESDRRRPGWAPSSPQGWVHGVSESRVSLPASLNPSMNNRQPELNSAHQGRRRSSITAVIPAPHREANGSGYLRAMVIIWNHRHEHDKGPERLLLTVQALIQRGLRFRLHLLGQRFRQRPAAFVQLEQQLADYYAAQGMEPGINRFIEDRQEYEAILRAADMVLSTADHDFQGLSMLEAAALGCMAIAPDALAYPEYLPAAGLYPVHGLSLEQQAAGAADRIVYFARQIHSNASGHPSSADLPDNVLALKASNLAPLWQQCLLDLLKV